MSRLGAMAGDIRPLWPGASVLGAVLPVWVRSGDNVKLHQALEVAQNGDVLVVNGQGSLSNGLFGDLMAAAARFRGVVGIVIDGAVRDISSLQEMRFPTFGRGVCAAGPGKEGSGEVGFPVACGGVVCNAGDVLVGDGDGVVIIPRADIKDVAASAWQVFHNEEAIREHIARGEPIYTHSSAASNDY